MKKIALRYLMGSAAFLILGATAVRADDRTEADRGQAVSVVASTVPANGDLNPYGVARVRTTKGRLHAGQILVSNFNNSANLQGTGTTIVQISPQGTTTLFAQINAASLPGACPGGVGLTTSLVALRSGFVIVGSLPTTDGTAATIGPGCLIVLDSNGTVVETLSGPLINGPWDMTARDHENSTALFVANVLDGSVVRIMLDISSMAKPAVKSMTVIGSGFSHRTDPAALVIGPTGVGLGEDGILYVADSLNNRIAAIPHAISRTSSAGTGTTVSQGGTLNDPLGLAIGPDKDAIATVNGNDGFLVITTADGRQVFKKLLDSTGTPPGNGTLFGLTFAGEAIYFVDDGTNTLNVLR